MAMPTSGGSCLLVIAEQELGFPLLKDIAALSHAEI